MPPDWPDGHNVFHSSSHTKTCTDYSVEFVILSDFFSANMGRGPWKLAEQFLEYAVPIIYDCVQIIDVDMYIYIYIYIFDLRYTRRERPCHFH
jgi:hypothetical protein